MHIMQTAVGHMHEEEPFERPERDDLDRNDLDRTDPLAADSAQLEGAPDGRSADADAYLLNHANREASRRKNELPEQGSKPFAGKQFIDRSIAAGPNGLTDEQLFQQYQNGNEDAFFTIYERYKSSIYAYCAHVLFGVGFSRETVEDTFQEIFLRLIQYRHTFSGGDFKPWIFTVTRHACLTVKRETFRDRPASDVHDLGKDSDGDDSRQAISPNEDPLEMMTKSEQIALLIAAIAKLPDEFRQALVLSEYEELSYDEISKILGVSMSTVRIRIFRAKAKLRKMLLPVLLGDPPPEQATKV